MSERGVSCDRMVTHPWFIRALLVSAGTGSCNPDYRRNNLKSINEATGII